MRAVVLSLLLPVLVACSSLVPKLEKPTLSIVNVELLKSDVFEQRMKVRLHVQNPNDRALPIKGITYGLEVAGEPFANGVSGESFVVPALGEAEFGQCREVGKAAREAEFKNADHEFALMVRGPARIGRAAVLGCGDPAGDIPD